MLINLIDSLFLVLVVVLHATLAHVVVNFQTLQKLPFSRRNQTTFEEGVVVPIQSFENPNEFISIISNLIEYRASSENSLPVVLCHCNSLEPMLIIQFQNIDNVGVIDLCEGDISREQKIRSTGSHSATIEALFKSPFKKSIFFKSIHTFMRYFLSRDVFDLPSFTRTGAIIAHDASESAEPIDSDFILVYDNARNTGSGTMVSRLFNVMQGLPAPDLLARGIFDNNKSSLLY